jgi:hypothetical protein
VNTETEAQIRNVRKFGGYARAFCIVMFVVMGIVALWTIRNVLFGPGSSGFRADLGSFSIRGDQIVTGGVKVWVGFVCAAVFTVIFEGLFHLYRLFGNFRVGSIYTRENAGHIRQLGVLALIMGVMQILLPIVSMALLEAGVIPESSITRQAPRLVFGFGSFGGFILAAVILLASWIIDIGTRTREEADEMRRDAELVI